MKIVSVFALAGLVALGGCSGGTVSSKPVEKLEFPANQLLQDLVMDLPAARQKWVGRNIEFQFRPSSYEEVDGAHRMNGQDTPFFCDVDKETYEGVALRKAEYYIIVRGVVGEIDLDKPVELENCEVVSLTDTGWQPTGKA